LNEPPAAEFDLVLVDAPCSGSGTWRRQPELKWRLVPERLEALLATQDHLLERAALHVRPGGRLVYATCSILLSENDDRVEHFLDVQRSFVIRPANCVATSAGVNAPVTMVNRFFTASPLKSSTDGFFTAILERTG